jgi:NADH-quinone oxidoreductase subunit A
VIFRMNHQRRLRTGNLWHVKLNQGVTLWTGLHKAGTSIFASFNLHFYFCSKDRIAILLPHRYLQFRVATIQPGFRIGQFQYEPPGFAHTLWLPEITLGGLPWRVRGVDRRRNCELQHSGPNLLDYCPVLLIQPQFQSLLPILIQGKQIKIVIGSSVQDAPVVVHRRVDQGVSWSAIFCLHMKRNVSEFEIGVVPEDHDQHLLPVAQLSLSETRSPADLSGMFSGAFDRWRLTRYYNSLTMTPSGLHAYVPLLIHLLVAAVLAGALILISTFIGWRRPNKAKQQPYECGITPTGDAREPFSVKFYLVAMVFILFDVEAIFLYPWAYIFKDLARNVETRWFGFIEMMLYVAILLVGYIYLWKKGALDWHKSQK